MQNRVVKARYRRSALTSKSRHVCVIPGRWCSVTSSASSPNTRACGDRRSRALARLENGVASVRLTAVANRAGLHYSAVRRYFSSHKEVLLHLAAEGWVRWSSTVCAALREPVAMSPSRVAETLASGLATDPPFCELLANLHLEHDVILDKGRRDQAHQRRCREVARGCDRAGVVGAGPLGRTKRPSCRLLMAASCGRLPPAAEADRRLPRTAG
jgi:AcrR family transcriptional regulator